MPVNTEQDTCTQGNINVAKAMAEKFIGKVSWKIMLFRSIASIAAGIMVFSWPAASLVAIAIIIGIYFIFNGIMAFSAAFSLSKGKFFMFFYGLLCIFAGSIAFNNPLFTDYIIMLFIAAWAIINGISELGLCFKIHGGSPAKLALGFAGVISVLFGVIVLLNPQSSLGIFVWIAGFYFLMTCLSMLFLTLSLKGVQNRINDKAPDA